MIGDAGSSAESAGNVVCSARRSRRATTLATGSCAGWLFGLDEGRAEGSILLLDFRLIKHENFGLPVPRFSHPHKS